MAVFDDHAELLLRGGFVLKSVRTTTERMLISGERPLRLRHSASGLCFEKRIDPELPVVARKNRWLQVFESLLAHELLAT